MKSRKQQDLFHPTVSGYNPIHNFGIIIEKSIIILFIVCIFPVSNIYPQDYFWEKSDKPEGGVIYSILIEEDTLIIGGKGGVYFSTNSGESWESLGLNSVEVWDVENCSNYIIANTSGGCFRKHTGKTDWEKIKSGRYQALATNDTLIYLGSENEGIYRSKDCGQSWEQIINGIDNRDIEEIFVTSSNILLASASGTSGSGVFRSLDMGDNWSRIDPYQYAWNFHGISEVNRVLYAFDFTNNARVYRSDDDGLSWYVPGGSIPPSDIINSIYADSDGLYVGVYHYGFFYSRSGGAYWLPKNIGLQSYTLSEIKGSSTELYLASYDGFYKSNKEDIRWERYMSGINSANITSLAQNNEFIFVGTSGSGLFRASKDLSNWQKMFLGNNNEFTNSILATENKVFALVSTWSSHHYAELYISANNGSSWTSFNPDLHTSELKTIVGDEDVQFIGSGNGVYRSTNSGLSWIRMENGMPTNINSSSIALYDSIVIVTNGTSGIYKSENMGENWSYIQVPDLFSGKAVAVSSGGVFYLGSGSVNKIFSSKDYGKTWIKLNNPLYNSSVEAIGVNSNLIVCCLSNNGILSSSDGGDSWRKNNYGLESQKVNCVSISEYHNFIGTNSGLYKQISSQINPISDYNEVLHQNFFLARWQKSPGINNYHIQVSTDSLFLNIVIDDIIGDTSYTVNNLDFMTDCYWRVSTVTDYWTNNFSSVQKVVISNPVTFKLYNNYPNPFNDETNIRVDVPHKSEIKLNLYTILGEKVKTIENSIVESGTHYFKLKTNDLASGVYLIRLFGLNYSVTKKAVLLH